VVLGLELDTREKAQTGRPVFFAFVLLTSPIFQQVHKRPSRPADTMFYAQLILGKKGALGKVWLAVHSEKKLNRNIIFSTDVTKSAGRLYEFAWCQ
jgi:hypothetical protein